MYVAIYLCTVFKKGISSLQAGRQIEATQKTAKLVLHRVREMLRTKAPYVLQNTVQIDKAYINEKKTIMQICGLKGNNCWPPSDKINPVIRIVENKAGCDVKRFQYLVIDDTTRARVLRIYDRHTVCKTMYISLTMCLVSSLFASIQFKLIMAMNYKPFSISTIKILEKDIYKSK